MNPFFIKISTFLNHNAAIDKEGNIFTWGIKFERNFNSSKIQFSFFKKN